MTEDAAPTTDILGLTADIVAAYLANHSLAPDAVPGLITATHAAFAALQGGAVEPPAEPAPLPAVTARKSLADPEVIISMIDGKPYKSLKRHLSSHGLSPADYRARYGLSADYPMVAPAYSERRRAVALSLGLGRKPAAPPPPVPKTTRGRTPSKAD
ncbi:MucR family transcriptional regulator [Brevundimonas sp. SORGH_AS_0993]|uniref:MucR family transcriptional regulator n=1 Tax=Brevundimonas sp. SORGH_AS_0993 TaxID=3041794 RepID=UPI00277F8564|nr:MucR family transcriptional regulator [Brevundimonas sp. SORGH_AS_0993]MDQ1153432.1 putative transcriptional regulator [Brevundimonas sp. SORGH_AS_0993]